jgi:hypothetical protein
MIEVLSLFLSNAIPCSQRGFAIPAGLAGV